MRFSHFIKQSAIVMVLAFVAALFMGSEAEAQVRVQMTLNKKSYLINESIKATLQITNQTGSDLVLSASGGKPWLTFNLKANSEIVAQTTVANFSSIVVPTGKTVAKGVVLNAVYPLDGVGNYGCEATVHLREGYTGSVVSNRAGFSISTGRAAWSERVGVPGSSKEVREYRLVNFSGGGRFELFAEVHSVNGGYHISTIPLSEALNFRNPSGVLDKANTLHILYQVRPQFFVHANIGLDGNVISSSHIKRGKGTPALAKRADGSVIVVGGTLYDAKAAAADRKKIYDASERPDMLFK